MENYKSNLAYITQTNFLGLNELSFKKYQFFNEIFFKKRKKLYKKNNLNLYIKSTMI